MISGDAYDRKLIIKAIGGKINAAASKRKSGGFGLWRMAGQNKVRRVSFAGRQAFRLLPGLHLPRYSEGETPAYFLNVLLK
jgi:hypothetical protein